MTFCEHSFSINISNTLILLLPRSSLREDINAVNISLSLLHPTKVRYRSDWDLASPICVSASPIVLSAHRRSSSISRYLSGKRLARIDRILSDRVGCQLTYTYVLFFSSSFLFFSSSFLFFSISRAIVATAKTVSFWVPGLAKSLITVSIC